MPPALPGSPPPPAGPRLGWAVAVGLMLLYIAVPAVLGLLRPSDGTAILPAEWGPLLGALGVELALFTTLFVVAVAVARPTLDDLRLRWRGGWRPLVFGLGWSVALRVLVGAALVAGLAVAAVAQGWSTREMLEFRPKLENVVDIAALGRNPLYLVFMATVVSFVVAGLREELWRVMMLAGLERLAPGRFGTPAGRWAAVVVIALAFGLAHSPQGWVGVGATFLIGIGLGGIILLHRSIWEAVLAHGFFNATSFVLLPWVAHRWPEVFPS
ncbi:MAG: lysostaphin resistance A-like protein [Limisphaerales bacterium]